MRAMSLGVRLQKRILVSKALVSRKMSSCHPSIKLRAWVGGGPGEERSAVKPVDNSQEGGTGQVRRGIFVSQRQGTDS
jgi:hypothetical protein